MNASFRKFRSTILRHFSRPAAFRETPEPGRVHCDKKSVRFVVRPVAPADLPQLVELWRHARSIDCVSCIRSWMETDPGGIHVAVTTDGEVAGSCALVINGDDEDEMGFGGFFHVHEKFRSKGIGVKIWDYCYKHIGVRNAGLNAMSDKLSTYRDKGGFPLHDPRFTTLKYISASWPPHFASLRADPPPGVRLLPLRASHLPAIAAYDAGVTGFRRHRNVRLNVTEEGSRTLVALEGSDDGGALVGFGTAKATVLGAVRVGSLYADDPRVAEALLRRLVEGLETDKGFAMVTNSANSVAKGWMERLGVELREEYNRLYTVRALNPNLSKAFASFDNNFAPI